jgi:protein-S-isoprenylcysteine O-methyltransferase Ste14
MNDKLIGIFVFVIYILNIVFVSIKSPIIPFYGLIFAILGLFIAICGLILWILGFLSLRSSFAIAPKAKKLIKTGIYEHLRHPIYNGIILTFFGLGLAKGSIISLLFTLFILYPFLRYRSHLEEKTLINQYDKEYIDYIANSSSLT